MRRVGNQEHVVNMFLRDEDARSYTGNLVSEKENGVRVLRHYWTTSAVITPKGQVINSTEDYAYGFAKVTQPLEPDAWLPLTSIREQISRKLETLEIVHVKGLSFWDGEVLFKLNGKYYLFGIDDSAKPTGRFIAELPKPVRTVEEAYEVLTPKICRVVQGVLRQGEWFFVPLKKKFRDKEKGFKPVEPGSRHRVTKRVEVNGLVVVGGTVRHPEHKMLKLNGAWFLAVKNNAVRGWSVQRNGGAVGD